MPFTPIFSFFFFNDTATTEIYTLSLHDALPIVLRVEVHECGTRAGELPYPGAGSGPRGGDGAVPVERDAVHALGGRPGPVRVWQPLPSLPRRSRGRLRGAAVRPGDVWAADSVPRGATGGAGGAGTHTWERMAAWDRTRPARDERGAARSTRARQPAANRAGAARVARRTASGVRAGRR